MPGSRPPAADLLAIVQDYLERRIAPQVSPVDQFQLKIVSRVLATVRREVEQGAAIDEAETARLRALLRTDNGSRRDLNTALARAIREGAIASDDPALLAHLRRTVEDALAINNPKWVAPAV